MTAGSWSSPGNQRGERPSGSHESETRVKQTSANGSPLEMSLISLLVRRPNDREHVADTEGSTDR